jgi:hypothetical protein
VVGLVVFVIWSLSQPFKVSAGNRLEHSF